MLFFLFLQGLALGQEGSLYAQTVFVWPGDANDNGMVNQVDLVYLGLSFGLTGTSRDSISTLWMAHETPKWLLPMFGLVDPAHADCNGDSTVNILDLQAMELNYGLDNGFILSDSSSLSTLPQVPEIGFHLNNDSLSAGSLDTIDLWIGEEDLPMDSMLAFSMAISFDTHLVDTAYAWFGDSWLGTEGLDMVGLDHFEPGRLEVAATRIDRTDALQGSGRIGSIVVVMDDNLKQERSLSSMNLHIDELLCMTVGRRVRRLRIGNEELPTFTPSNNFNVLIYPVPTTKWLNLEVVDPLGESVNGRVFDTLGHQQLDFQFDKGFYKLDSQSWRPGVYLLELQRGEQVFRQRFLIQP